MIIKVKHHKNLTISIELNKKYWYYKINLHKNNYDFFQVMSSLYKTCKFLTKKRKLQ